MENSIFQHPDGKIQLLNGNVLDCCPLEQLQENVNNQVKLDTTDSYLSVGKPPKRRTSADSGQVEADKRLFLSNAFRFLAHRDRILSDSRMFLCPVPFTSGLAYTGTSGFNRPTLGVYMEWWLHCAQANIVDGEGGKWLVYHLAGSPMSGSNRCGIVSQNGETKTQALSHFIGLWPMFQKINCRYDEAKSRYQSYTLQQVIDIFDGKGLAGADDKDMQIYFLKQTNRKLQKRMKSLEEYTNRIYLKLHKCLLTSKVTELQEFMSEYRLRREHMDLRKTEIQAERKRLRKLLKTQKISNIEYQRQWMPLHRESDRLESEFASYRYDTLHSLFPDDRIEVAEVEAFLSNTNK